MKIIIAGAYAIGTHLAKLLSRNNENITLIDENAERLAKISTDFDLLTLEASPGSIKALKEAGAESADLYISVTPDEALNLNSCMLAKAIGTKKTVAKIDSPEYIAPDAQKFFSDLGVSSLIYPEMLAAVDINNGLKMSWVRQRWDVHDGALVMLGIKLRESCEILNQPLKTISGPDDFMTTRNYIPYIRKIVGKEHYVDVKNVMIMGGGKTAVRAVKTMPEYMDVKIIEQDEHRCEELNNILEDNVLVINGDGRDIPLLTEEGIRSTQAFVALTGNAETNILACLTAKRMGVRKTVAMVENLDYVAMAESLDIGTIINKKAIAAGHIYQMMLDADVMNVKFLNSANADVAEFVVGEGAKVTRKPVKDLGLPPGVTIGGLVREGEGMLVNGNTQIEPGDSVMIFCHNVNMKKIEKFF